MREMDGMRDGSKRQGGGGWKKRRMDGEERRDGEEKRGRGLVYWIYLLNSRKKNIIHHLIFLLHVGEAALMAALFGVQGRCQVSRRALRYCVICTF